MSDYLQDLAQEHVFEELEYCLLYLRPTPYADERIAVGLISTRQNSLEARFLSSVSAIERMEMLLGEESAEQFQFGAAEVRRAIRSLSNLDDLSMPTDLFVPGEKLIAYTHDRNGLLTSLLASASCLMRTGATEHIEPSSVSPSVPIQRDLFEQVSRLNPLVGNRIFNNKVTIRSGQVINLPILGDRIFGAPISFAAKDQMMKAESFVAKFHWLNGQVPQDPRIYLLARGDGKEPVARSESGVRELLEIAAASGVEVRISESTEHMASQVLKDEAA